MSRDRRPKPKVFQLTNPDGSFNLQRTGLRDLKAGDLYHSLLGTAWPVFLCLVLGVYVAINLVFATAYLACGPNALNGAQSTGVENRFFEAFFFSIQTFATIGYGHVSPHGAAANILVTLEALVGMLSLALATGVIFSRFARPTAKVVFSRNAIVSKVDNVPSFHFRMGNSRLNQVVDAQVSLHVLMLETTAEGETYRNFHNLALERSHSPLFALSWTVMHPITPESPIYGMTPEKLKQAQAVFMVTMSGIDDTFASTIYARHSYTPEHIRYDYRFEDILKPTGDGRILVDMDKIHDMSPLA